MFDNKNFITEFADVFEVDPSAINPEFSLIDNNWDSLAIISTIALLDEHFGVIVDGKKLASCTKASDIAALFAN